MLPTYDMQSMGGGGTRPRHRLRHCDGTERRLQHGVWSRPPAAHLASAPATNAERENECVSSNANQIANNITNTQQHKKMQHHLKTSPRIQSGNIITDLRLTRLRQTRHVRQLHVVRAQFHALRQNTGRPAAAGVIVGRRNLDLGVHLWGEQTLLLVLTKLFRSEIRVTRKNEPVASGRPGERTRRSCRAHSLPPRTTRTRRSAAGPPG